MTLTKGDLVDTIYEHAEVSKKEAAILVEMVFDSMKECILKGEKMKLSGFGNFEVKRKRARMGRNPKTGESVEIRARKVVTFKLSQVLRDRVDGSELVKRGQTVDSAEGDWGSL